MGKLGRYQHPDIGPEQSTSIVRTIDENIGDTLDKGDREELATLLGHDDADSGAFKQKLTALKRYGLLEGRGKLSTTELAGRVVGDDQGVYREMLENVPLLDTAYEQFDGEPVESLAWRSFLEEEAGIEGGADEIPGASRLRDIYLEFVRLIPDEQTSEESTELLDKERDFDYYIEKLDNPNTRKPAFDALNRNLSEKKLADAEPLKVVLKWIQEDKYPDNRAEVFRLLRTICQNNKLERLNSGKQDEVVELLYRKQDALSDPENYDYKPLKYILDILEIIHPDDIVETWWELLLRRLKDGDEASSWEVSDFALGELGNRLLDKRGTNNEISIEFYEDLSDDAENTVWELMAEDENETLQEDCEFLLEKMDVL